MDPIPTRTDMKRLRAQLIGERWISGAVILWLLLCVGAFALR